MPLAYRTCHFCYFAVGAILSLFQFLDYFLVQVWALEAPPLVASRVQQSRSTPPSGWTQTAHKTVSIRETVIQISF